SSARSRTHAQGVPKPIALTSKTKGEVTMNERSVRILLGVGVFWLGVLGGVVVERTWHEPAQAAMLEEVEGTIRAYEGPGMSSEPADCSRRRVWIDPRGLRDNAKRKNAAPSTRSRQRRDVPCRRENT